MPVTMSGIKSFHSYSQKLAFLDSAMAAVKERISAEHHADVATVAAYDSAGAQHLLFAKDRGSMEARGLLRALEVARKETPDDDTPLPNSWPTNSIIFDPKDNRLPCWVANAENCGPDGLRALGAIHGNSPQRARLNASLSRLHAKPISFASYLYFSGVAHACGRTIETEEVDGEMIANVSPMIWAAKNVNTSPLAGKPHLCYFVRITRLSDGAIIYKIGITSTSVAHRFHKESGIEITVLASWSYACKAEAERHEATVKRDHLTSKAGEIAKGFLAHGGWTECFTSDVLCLDSVAAIAA